MMQRLYFNWLITFALVIHTTTAVAEVGDKATTAKTLTTSPVTSTALIETVLGLGLVLGIIAILAWLIKRTGRFQSTANGEIKMIAGLSLGPRERAVLLEVKGERILVGVTAHQIQTLHVLGKTADIPTEAPQAPQAQPQQTQTQKQQHQDKYGQFDQQLKHILKQEPKDD